jgi:kinetochore protein Spc24, fungi type
MLRCEETRRCFVKTKLLTCDRLQLKIYRSLGIDIEPDEAGNYNKAIIRNTKKGDVHVVNIDPKFSKFFYANYFWQTIQT